MKKNNEKKVLNMVLVKGRHNVPQATDGAIFWRSIPTKAISRPLILEDAAFGGIFSAAEKRGLTAPSETDLYEYNINVPLHINIYTTGLTVALVAALNVCRKQGYTITLYHYNNSTGDYFPQEVI